MSKEVAIAQPVRKVVVFSQRDNQLVNVESDAVTWGQFKTEFSSEISFKNMRGVVKSTKNTLDVDEARLPDGEFTIFLFPKKVKSGMATYTKSEYLKSFTSKELRKMCSERGLGTSGGKEDFAKKLADYDKENQGAPTVKDIAPATTTTKNETLPAVKSSPIGIIENATVSTEMTVRITDVNQLNLLLETMFPNMEVVSVDALINLKAELKLGSAIPAQAPKKAAATVAKKPVKKPVIEKKASKKDLAAEAEAMAKEMNF